MCMHKVDATALTVVMLLSKCWLPVLKDIVLLAWTHSLPHPSTGAAESAQLVKTVSDVASLGRQWK